MDKKALQDREIRIDKWLWCARVYKTRQLATEACRGGKISVAGSSVRAAKAVRPGDVIEINMGGWTRTLKVVADLDHRVKASSLPGFLEDITPAEQLALARERRVQNMMGRPSGSGRPTKSDRRAWRKAFYGEGA